MILSLSAPLSVQAEAPPLYPSTHSDDVSVGTGRDSTRPVVFLANDNLPPMIYMQDGKLIGIIVDLGEALKKQMKQPVRLDYMGWAEAQQQVLEGKADALLHINSSEERKKRFDFSEPIIESEFSIYINHTSKDIYRPDGLRGLKVGVQNRGLAFNVLRKNPLISLVAFADMLDGFHSLKKNELDAVVMDRHVGSYLLAENDISGIRITGEPIDRSFARIAVRKGDTVLLAEINSALAAIKENGTYQEIMAKWQPQEVVFQTKGEVEAQKKNLLVLSALAVMAGVMILLLVYWARSLRRMVNERTVELVGINKSLETEILGRKKVESELRESHDYLRNLTDSVGDVIFSIKMPERKIEWVNESFKIFGYENEECIGKPTEFLYASREDFLFLGEKMKRAVAEGENIIHAEVNFKRKNGEVFPADTLTTLFRVNGEVVSTTGILRDISERKEAEDQLLAYQKRLKALASQLTIAEEKERKRIATDLHDDVCQSLALLRMQVSKARKKASAPALTTQLDDISETLLQTLQRTRHLMSDLSSPSMNEIGLSAAISELLEDLAKKRHNLETEFIDETTDLPRNMLDDTVRAILYRNVRELLTNIIKHARAQKVSVYIQKVDDLVLLSVRDDGIGFDPGAISRSNGQKSGFGLFSIKERMSDMNGTFEVVSAPGKGCKVLLTVPVAAVGLKPTTVNETTVCQ